VLNDHNESSGYEAVFKDLYLRDVAPPHPGEVLRDDILPLTGLTRSALAKRLGVTPQRLANVLAERTSITAELAMRLGTVLGHGARYWLGLQMQYDIWVTEQPASFTVKPIQWKRSGKSATARTPGYR
jgi:antitoxin HigA-1